MTLTSSTANTRRADAGSLTLPVPVRTRLSSAENAQKEVLDCAGNTQLMEGRLCQVTSSIRALVRSNRDLEVALQSDPDDQDFLQAVAENKLVLQRQCQVAAAFVKELQSHGANVELEDDIRQIIIALNEELISTSYPSEAVDPSRGEAQHSNQSDAGVYL